MKLVFFLLFGGLISSVSQADARLSLPAFMVSTGEWPPLISKHLPHHGPVSQVVQETFLLADLPITLLFHPWKRALEEVKLGRVQASYAWRATQDRKQYLIFSDDIYEGENVFFYLKGSAFDWQTLNDLTKYRLGGVLGYAYSDDFSRLVKQGKIHYDQVQQESSLLRMLLGKRIDAFPVNREVGLAMLADFTPQERARVLIHPKVISKRPLALVTAKTVAGERLIKSFNQALHTLKVSGRYQAIYQEPISNQYIK